MVFEKHYDAFTKTCTCFCIGKKGLKNRQIQPGINELSDHAERK